MNNEWHISQLTTEQAELRDRLAAELQISPLASSLLIRRNLLTAEDARAFIRPQWKDLHDPFLMRDMEAAVDRLSQAIERYEKILIYGDYDVDGTTAVSLMYKFLHKIYDNIDFYIPNRYTEGYGISFQGIDYAEEKGCSLIIALDCGIKAVDKVEYASKRNIDVIICDHHTPDAELPKAVAVLDPQRSDDLYPYSELSGCGVGFKLVQAYQQRHHLSEHMLVDLLELLAMSIASDIVPITGENRILAFYGLQQINKQPSVGLATILRLAGMEGQSVTINDLVFKVGPRVNACGRMNSGSEAVKLLITEDQDFATQMAEAVNAYNQDRKDTDKSIYDEALAILKADPKNEERYTTVVYGKDWHKGVVGIVASRLTETFYRPTIVLTEVDGMISGSARSVGGFDIYQAIDSCRDLLTNFGGHPFAAGLAMKSENISAFKARFEAYVAEHIEPSQQRPIIEVEDEICFDEITPQFFNILKHLEPFGPGNDRPLFVTRNVINYRYTKRVGKEGDHLRLDVTDRTACIAGIAFGQGDFAPYLQNGNQVDVCYSIEENTFNGRTNIQMMVQDIKKTGDN